MMWFEGSLRIAAPQSVKRGLRMVKGLVLVKQWASLLEVDWLAAGGGGGDVRFTGWWMGERSDVGGTERERAVETMAVSRRRSRYDFVIVRNLV